MNESQKNKLWASLATVVTAIVLFVFLFYAKISCTLVSEIFDLPLNAEDSEILFAGEYVVLGDAPQLSTQDLTPSSASSSQEQEQKADDMHDSGEQGDAINLVSSERTSSMQEKKPQEQKKQGTKEKTETTSKSIAQKKNNSTDDNTSAKSKRKQQEEQTSKNISNAVGDAFAKSSASAKSQGSPNGNSTTGKLSGAPGHSLSGRTLESWGHPRSTVEGTVIVRVTVNEEGKVTKASYLGGTCSNATTRQNCVNESLKSRFSVSKNGAKVQQGVITWRFK